MNYYLATKSAKPTCKYNYYIKKGYNEGVRVVMVVVGDGWCNNGSLRRRGALIALGVGRSPASTQQY